jgi:N-dimethylarginine dimethylaminohydrolase
MIDNHFLIGISERTNQEGAEQMGHILDGQARRIQPSRLALVYILNPV